jgi:adenosine deaminase
MTRGADRRDLELYLETFVHTVGVMQTTDALARVAGECAEDLAADGVVYAEVRFAPELHTQRGLRPDDVVEPCRRIRQSRRGATIRVNTIVTAMRPEATSLEVAELALRWADRGGRPRPRRRGRLPQRRLSSVRHDAPDTSRPDDPRRENDWRVDPRALACGASVSAGVRLAATSRSAPVGDRLGPLAREVQDRELPLETLPGARRPLGGRQPRSPEHPISAVAALGFQVTVAPTAG